MKCKHIKINGEQCGANAMIDIDFCFSHNPKSKKDKKLAVLRGGLAPKPRKEAALLSPVQIRSVGKILLLLEDTINRIRTDPMTHQKANCIGYLANISLRALEIEEFEERLEKLEEDVASLRK